MNFTCDQCQKVYSIADEKVAGRAFRVTCKQCGRPTWKGCGLHVEQVLGNVPPEDRCACVAAPKVRRRWFAR